MKNQLRHCFDSVVGGLMLWNRLKKIQTITKKHWKNHFKKVVGVEPTLTCFITNMIMLEMNHAVQLASCFYLLNVLRVLALRCTLIVAFVVSDVVTIRFAS